MSNNSAKAAATSAALICIAGAQGIQTGRETFIFAPRGRAGIRQVADASVAMWASVGGDALILSRERP